MRAPLPFTAKASRQEWEVGRSQGPGVRCWLLQGANGHCGQPNSDTARLTVLCETPIVLRPGIDLQSRILDWHQREKAEGLTVVAGLVLSRRCIPVGPLR